MPGYYGYVMTVQFTFYERPLTWLCTTAALFRAMFRIDSDQWILFSLPEHTNIICCWCSVFGAVSDGFHIVLHPHMLSLVYQVCRFLSTCLVFYFLFIFALGFHQIFHYDIASFGMRFFYTSTAPALSLIRSPLVGEFGKQQPFG